MTFTPEEIKKLKTMLLFLCKKKHEESNGSCGFHPMELNQILDELEADGEVQLRPCINSNRYFLTNK